MSNNIDERIVQMRFDNKDFDKNVKATMRTMSELNSSMDMSSSAQKFNKSMNSMNENTGLLTTTMDKVGKSWSAWEIIAITAISNITNRVIDLGIRLAESLSVDQIAAGWDKFSEATKNQATLLAQGYDKKDVDVFNDMLSQWSDASSFSAEVMQKTATAIAQNTDAELKEAAEMAIGITTMISKAGKGINDLQGVAAQIQQAMQAGYLSGNDLKSLKQTWGVFTKDFQEQLKETAIAMNTVYQAGEDLYNVNGKVYTSQQLMSEAISSEHWITSEVLGETLKKYAYAVSKAYDVAAESGDTLYNVINDAQNTLYSSDMDEEIKALMDFGLNAAKAAQECRTLEDAITAIKKVVSTSFQKSFTTIIGESKEATELWGQLYDSLEKIFMAGDELRNNTLKAWKELGGRDDLFANTEENMGALFSLLNTANEIFQTFRESFYDVFFGIDITASDASEKLANVFKQLTSSIKKFADNLNKFVLSHKTEIKNIIKIVFNGIKVIINVLKIGINLIKSVVKCLKPLTNLIGGSEGILNAVEKLNTKLEQFNKTSKIFAKVEKTLTKLTNQLANSLIKLNIFDKLKKGFDNMKKALMNNGKTVDALKKIWNAFKTIITKLGNEVIKVFPKITRLLGKGFTKSLNLLAKGLEKIVKVSSDLSQKVKEWKDKPKTIERWNKVLDVLSNTLNKFKNALKNTFSSKNMTKLGKSLKFSLVSPFNILLNTIKQLIKYINKLGKSIRQNIIKQFKKANKSALEATNKNTTSLIKKVKDAMYYTKYSDPYWANNGDEEMTIDKIQVYTKLGKTIHKLYEPITKMLIALKNLSIELIKLFTILLDTFTALIKVIETKLNKLPKIFDKFNKLTGKNIVKRVALIASLILLVKILYEAISLLTIISKMAKVVTAIGNFINAKAFSTVIYSISSLIRSLALLTLSLALISKIDSKQIWKSVGVLSTLMAALTVFSFLLVGIMKLLGPKGPIRESLTSGKMFFGFKSYEALTQTSGLDEMGSAIAEMSKSFTRLALAISIMVFPLKKLANMKEKIFWLGFARLASIIGSMTIYSAAMIMASKTRSKDEEINANSKFVKSLTNSVLATSLSILPLAYVMKKVSKLNASVFWKGFGRLMALYGALSALTVAIALLSCRKLKSSQYHVANTRSSLGMDQDSLKEISKESGFMDPKLMRNIAFTLLSIGASAILIARATNMLASLKLTKFIKAAVILTGMLSALSMISLALIAAAKTKAIKNITKTVNIDKTKSGISNTIASIGLTLIGIGVAVAGIAASIVLLGSLPKKQLKRGIILTSIILGVVTGLALLINKFSKQKDLTNEPKINPRAISSITSILYAFVGLGTVFGVLSLLDDKKLTRGFVALTAITIALLSTIGLTTLLVKNINKDNKLAFLNIIAIASSFIILAGVFAILSRFNWKSFKKISAGLGIMTGSLLILFGATMLINKFIKYTDIGKLGIMIGILTGLALILQIFNKLNVNAKIIKNVAKAVGTIVVAIAALSVTAGIIGLAAPILSLGAVIILALAGSMLALAGALQIFSMINIDAALENLMKFFNYINENKESIIAGITNIATIIITSLCNAITQNAETIATAIFETLITVIDILTKYVPQLGNALWNLAAAIIKFAWDKIGKDMFGIFKDLILFPFENLKNSVSIIKNTIKTIFKDIKAFFKGEISFKDLGKHLIKGLWNGIQEKFNWLTDKIQSFGNKIKNTFKKIFNIHSPSKFTAELGAYLVEGLAVGMNEEKDVIEKPLNEMANMITDGIDDQFTITPVLDLTEIQNGTKKMSSMLGSSDYSVNASMANSAQSSLNNTRAAELRAASMTQQTPASAGENITLNNVFNITGETDPNEIADAVSKKIAEQISRRKTTWQ